MEEIWKDIEGYEGAYQVSNYGRVRSLDRKDGRGNARKGQILILRKNRNGYLQAALSKMGKHKLIYVHRLVAKSFIDNPDGLDCVNHKDEDKSNNIVSNLEWCDQKYNLNYGKMSGSFRSERLTGINHPNSRLSEEQVLEIRRMYSQRKSGKGLTYLSKKFGVCKSQIWEIATGRSWGNI